MSVDMTVELFIDNAWVDVTTYVRDDPGVQITYGVQNEGGLADPSQCTLTLDNADGRFTPRNTSGAYYPYLIRNTPLRVSVGAAIRYHGYVSEFPTRWNLNASTAWVPIVANGAMRRLLRSNVLDSTLKSGIADLARKDADITGYWPIEDSEGSTAIASGLPAGNPGTLIVAPDFEAVDPGVMSKPVATWDGANALFPASLVIPGDSMTLGFLLTLPSSGMTSGRELIRVRTTGTAMFWLLRYDSLFAGTLRLNVYSDASVLIEDVLISPTGMDGTTHYIKIEVQPDGGGGLDWYAGPVTGGSTGNIAAVTLDAPLEVQIGAGFGGAIEGDVGIGHVVLGRDDNVIASLAFDSALAGYAGESVDNRLTRLDAQTDVTIAIDPGPTEPAEMGAQPDGSLMDVLRAAEKADIGGILADRLTTDGLAYIARMARYNEQNTDLTLDYAAGHFTPPLEPTDDDQNLRNDVTATRLGGSSARRVLESGALSIQDYPDGVGPYRFEDSYATYEDSEIGYVADWILALGTIDETRWPRITIDLVTNASLVTDWDAMRLGHVVHLENLPDVSGVADTKVQVIGWSEVITNTRRNVTMNCVPAYPWHGVMQLDDAVFGELDVMRLAL